MRILFFYEKALYWVFIHNIADYLCEYSQNFANMNFKIIDTEDGSKTIYISELNETYHSKYGAINEAKHVYIDNGIKRIEKSNITVCEIGFGTGLNALQTLIYAINNNLIINYITYDKFPLEQDITSNLNYGKLCGYQAEFEQINSVSWNTAHNISENFMLTKKQTDILDKNIEFPTNFDIIYFDAFAPSKQPEMWNAQLFKKLYLSLSDKGILVSYASAGVVKQALRTAGFKIKRLPGPKGKFHMIAAEKQHAAE